MMISLKYNCVASFLVLILISPATLAADKTTLRLGHLWPAVAAAHKGLLEVWADTVSEESGGKLNVELYPSSTLSKAPAQYDAVKSRIMDATATVLGYSANRFPLTQIVELPGVAKNAVQGSCIVQSLYDEGLIADEFKDSKPLFFFVHGPGLLHAKGKAIKTPEDLAGLRIRRPTTLVAGILDRFGAQPVSMPAPTSYQSLSRGVIDGVAFAWAGALSFRLNELADTHTEFGGLYTLAFVVTMNKDVYNSLSDDMKAVLDRNSGSVWSKKAGVIWDEQDVEGRAQAVEAGHEIITLEGGVDNPAWNPVLIEATESYLDGLEKKGLPARKVHARAVELAALCE